MILPKCGIKAVATKKRRDRRVYFRAYFSLPSTKAARRKYQRKYFSSDKGKTAKRRYKQSAKGKANRHRYFASQTGLAAKRRWRRTTAGRASNRRCRERWLNTPGGQRYKELHDSLRLPTCAPVSLVQSIKLLRALKQEIRQHEYR